MQVITDWGADSELEILAKDKLAELERRYRAEAEPYLKMLVEAKSLKAPKYYVILGNDEAPNFASIPK